MSWKSKRRELQGIVGGLGVVVAIAGFVGGFMTVPTTIVATFAVWIVGATAVNFLTDPTKRG